jgi:hypothetical protein
VSATLLESVIAYVGQPKYPPITMLPLAGAEPNVQVEPELAQVCDTVMVRGM